MTRKGESAKRYHALSSEDELDSSSKNQENLTSDQVAANPSIRRTRSRISFPQSEPTREQAQLAKDQLESDVWRSRPEAQFVASVSVPAATISTADQDGDIEITSLLQPVDTSNLQPLGVPAKRRVSSGILNENAAPFTTSTRRRSRLRAAPVTENDDPEFETPPPEDRESDFDEPAVPETESDAYSEGSASRPRRSHAGNARSQGTASTKRRRKPSTSGIKQATKKLQSLKVDPKKGAAPIRCAPKSKWTSESMNELPPISSIQDIFTDITKRNEQLKDVALHLNGRPLRVATMCSGTESPLLALGLLTANIKSLYGVDMEVEHVFSCEIEPWKQAYIERNFQPPILFRDVCELGEEYATTAYGAKAKVPGNCDLLVAGTSCVDYSSLNNHGKGINDGGESGRTFWGMFSWVKKHRPKLVILENVCGAPWGHVVLEFERIGYAAGHTRFDTKNYYIPHTRQRGYLVAFDTKDGNLPTAWVDKVNNLTRPASVSFESFLLESDDPRVLEARQKLFREEGSKGKTHDWTACEIRHTNARNNENLGRRRPFTDWQEGGVTKYPDFTWQEWGDMQVDRVNDLLDISYLRNVKKGIDISYKARLWNLSQNVDRETEGKSSGVSQCLTPTMIPFLTARGGPMIGVELLSLQGLPVEQLLLTRESEANLKDLAGNAMSSTVVGTAIVASLVIGKDLLNRGNGKLQLPVLLDKKPEAPIAPLVNPSFQELDLAGSKQLKIKDLLKAATRSARMCVCEGRTLMSTNSVQICSACGHSSCTKCGQKPTHVYTAFDKFPRIEPSKFEDQLKDILPMLVKLKHGRAAIILAIQAAERLPIRDTNWSLWMQHAIPAISSTFTFKTMKRQEIWIVEYESAYGKLHLLLDPEQIEWRFFVKIDWMAEEWKELRGMFANPVAQMVVGHSGKSLLNGSWRIGVPGVLSIDVQVEGSGELVDSWEKSVGIAEPKLGEKMVYSNLNVALCDPSQAKLLDEEITGRWELLPKCGTANRALHRKATSDGRHIFLFLDPNRLGNSKDDCFIISRSHKRLAFEEARMKVAKFDSVFRPSAEQPKLETQVTVDTFWVSASGLRLKSSGGKKATFAFSIPQNIALHTNCNIPAAFIVCSAPATPAVSERRSNIWRIVDEAHAGETFNSITWLVERMKLGHRVGDWVEYIITDNQDMECTTCAPPKPSISWRPGKERFGPIEDSEMSALWERAMKARPSPWMTALKVDEESILHLNVGLNLTSLIHRAADLLRRNFGLGCLSVSWRLTSSYVNPPRLVLPDFLVRSNREDPESMQPPGFILSLRREQLRSLSWMVSQESPNALDFIEQEIVEALHPQLQWKADVRASRPNSARGGVLADAVGYGKTAIILGLLARMKGTYVPPVDSQGRIPLKATLVIVPGHLCNQWENEIHKFTGDLFVVTNIRTLTNLMSCTVKDFMSADIIIVAASLFKSPAYLQRLGEFAACIGCPNTGGRRFQHWLGDVMEGLKLQAERLQSGRIAEVISAITEGCKRRQKIDETEGAPFLGRKSHNRIAAKGKEPAVDSPQTSDLEEDYDEAPKRKSKGAEKGPSTYDERRWKLRVGKGDWTDLVCPPLELFFFNRLTLDEFTYCTGMPLEVIPNLLSSYRWVLSGTPPLGDFADVKKIARFLSIQLGIDDDTANSALNNRAISKDRSAVESFQAFKEVRTIAWHQDRHAHAQGFLDGFMRQNVAELDEIPWEEHFITVKLPAAERAIYLELNHHLRALDMNLVKRGSTRGGGDREARFHLAIGGSASAEEALLKSCCHFSLHVENLSTDADADTACDVIIRERQAQLEKNQEELTQCLRDGLLLSRRWQHPTIPKAELQFSRYLEEKRKNALDDAEATAIFRELLQEAKSWAAVHEKKATVPSIVSKLKVSRQKAADEEDEREDEDDGANTKPKSSGDDTISLLKTIQFQTSRLLKELVGRSRSLRFFKVVREVQTLRDYSDLGTAPSWGNSSCTSCGKEKLAVEEVMVSSTCGHSGCALCMSEAAGLRNECPEKMNGCLSRSLDASLISAASLGAENDAITTYGAKLDALVDLLQSRIPAEERVLLFVQFPDLIKKVESVLKAAGIAVTRLAGSSQAKATDLTIFQSEKTTQVLLLEVMGETAAGANLTMANHVIFLSPLLTLNDQQYLAAETQAIGRARRYGQKKTVHIWRLVADKTIDVDTYRQRGNPVRC
ncbi:hypothetical protein H072_8336 [Dactylellina haptotyla CBS 200.50]|uniref:Helicase ATP-binding domain-containing protein n=1 Tax=Dactylellina haptotyla (strain CBS 200.50) TaxID=1284197 RepID=S8A511_DACHA|nr:hypothetical protein H072_8336 [Dactylellina haptotyla CBS 200.50]